MDLYPVHIKETVREHIYSTWPYIYFVLIPRGCTGEVQLPDVILNRPFKACITDNFMEYSVDHWKEMSGENMDLRMGTMKPLSFVWIMEAHARLVALEPSILRCAIDLMGYRFWAWLGVSIFYVGDGGHP